MSLGCNGGERRRVNKKCEEALDDGLLTHVAMTTI
jgi:hypothetical protein